MHPTAAWLHPGCAIDYTDDHALRERLGANSTGLGEAELGALAELL